MPERRWLPCRHCDAGVTEAPAGGWMHGARVYDHAPEPDFPDHDDLTDVEAWLDA